MTIERNAMITPKKKAIELTKQLQKIKEIAERSTFNTEVELIRVYADLALDKFGVEDDKEL